MSEENLKALSRLAALISEGYPFAALQSKIKKPRLDAIAPQGAHSTLLEAINQMRTDAKLAPVQLVVVATGREAEDTAAALRGAEIGAQIVLKATKVDGVYTADPKKDPSATRYSQISFDEAINRNLQVLDATAFALCRDQKLPIKVFSIFKPGALKRVVQGEDEGTLVHV